MFRLEQGLFSVGKDATVVKVIQSEKRKCLPVHDLKMFLLHATFFAGNIFLHATLQATNDKQKNYSQYKHEAVVIMCHRFDLKYCFNLI